MVKETLDNLSEWSPWQPTKEQPWDLHRVVHLHRRAGFAATWAEIERDLNDGHKAAINRVLRGTSRIDGIADEFENIASVIADAAVGSDNPERLKAWWLYRMLVTPDPLTEKLALMWHNHFATSNLKVANVAAIRQQNETLRTFCRAPFGRLLQNVAKDPALLVWLDADANRKEHPNENLAREIMELFTLGVGNYSESDIQHAARALTGWSMQDGQFHVHKQYHDDGQKTIFGKVGTWDGDDLLQMLLEHPATAGRLAFRICEMLMGEGVVSNEAIETLAAGLRRQNLEIGWAVETVLRSKVFFATENLGNRVLGPVEYVVGAVRALEVLDPPPSTLSLAQWVANLGQDLFYPPNVFGWPGGRSWLTSRSLIGRANFATSLISGNLHHRPNPLDAAGLAARHGYDGPEEIAGFYRQLLLGTVEPRQNLERLVDMPQRVVAAILASPEAQLG